MSINSLEKELDNAIDEFTTEIRLKYKEGSNNTVTESDVNEIARQVCYTFNSFKKSIITYLKEI